ncbi:hypothetical protein AB0D14_11115 [Streptomyces sp. NPDC048484]|uniref:hypothetical protein n=1 Tax=Streptomyces sp. NPDC048484 TaxID=3155146 RepID=UPI00342E4CAD
MSRIRPHSAVARAGGLLIIGLALTACSSGTSQEQREYAVPERFCGTAVDRDGLAALLPPGKKLTTREKYLDDKKLTERCDIQVDGKLVVRTSREWWPKKESTDWFATGKTRNDLGHQADDGRFLYSDYEAFGKTENCQRTTGAYEYAMFTGIQAYSSEHRDSNAMKDLIIHFTEAVEQSSDCD